MRTLENNEIQAVNGGIAWLPVIAVAAVVIWAVGEVAEGYNDAHDAENAKEPSGG